MDPDLVRLILVALGALLVAGIYLWDRYKRSSAVSRPNRRPPAEISDCPMVEPEAEARAEPRMDDTVESIPSMRAQTATTEERGVASVVTPESAPAPDAQAIGDWSDATADRNPQYSMDLSFDAHQEGDYLHRDPVLHDEVERKIVVINLRARRGNFRGEAIQGACGSIGLVAGDMSIYHFPDPNSGRVLFSLASMVEPGSFPFERMGGFSTPGLTLFTQLPGARDGAEIYDQMLSTAQHLARQLDAELLDEQRNPLTRQMQEHTRESIIEHRRRIRLGRSRH